MLSLLASPGQAKLSTISAQRSLTYREIKIVFKSLEKEPQIKIFNSFLGILLLTLQVYHLYIDLSRAGLKK
jgi:hypothetical protein